jgi:AraC-like DNA-binding protein
VQVTEYRSAIIANLASKALKKRHSMLKGIPVRRYLLWLRLRDAVEQVFNGMSFTYAAHHAGFSDSAHLSRTFKQMSGMTLTNYLKNSQSIQAISCVDG